MLTKFLKRSHQQLAHSCERGILSSKETVIKVYCSLIELNNQMGGKLQRLQNREATFQILGYGSSSSALLISLAGKTWLLWKKKTKSLLLFSSRI